MKLLAVIAAVWLFFALLQRLPALANALRRLLGLPEKRSVVGLGAGSSAGGRKGDVTSETIRRSGVLKPKHLRRIIRDERRMPKPPRVGKRPKLMSREAARRLFGATLRTTNRELATLDTDVAQLERLGLPVWKTEDEVAAALELSVNQLRHFSTHRQRERVSHYLSYAIPKRSGGTRIIHAPKRKLKAALRKLVALLGQKLPVSTFAHGFVKGRSVRTNAEGHVGKAVVLKMDLSAFFPSVTMHRVRGLFISYGYGYTVAATLAALVTEAERQPVDIDGTRYLVPVGPRHCVQGAPTSPAITNAILAKFDKRAAGLAKAVGFTYTRYADDLSFSGPSVDDAHRLRRRIERLVKEEGFTVNAAKTRVTTQAGPQRVTSASVNAVLGVSRQERRKLRAMLHQAKRNGADPKRQRQLDGLVAWVNGLNPAQAAALKGQ